MRKIRNRFFKIRRFIECYRKRRKLKIRDFTIIANNCWAGTAVYQPFGLRYNTPTVGLFFFDEDYVKFIEELEYYLALPIHFISPSESKYYDKITSKGSREVTYPIGLLDNDVEIHFLHYATEAEASEKWEKRKRRINRQKILIKMSIRDAESEIEPLLERFIALPFKNRIAFVASAPDKFKNNEQIVEVPEIAQLNLVGDDETSATLRHFDLRSLLNSIN